MYNIRCGRGLVAISEQPHSRLLGDDLSKLIQGL